MVLNLINIIEVAVVWALLFPHLIYASKSGEGVRSCDSKVLNIIEQIGRYASMLLMVLPLGLPKFGFPSNESMVLYFAVNAVLLAAYIICWVIYFKKRDFTFALLVAVLEAAVFFNCGLMLEHWFLVGSSILFAVGTVLVNLKRNKEDREND